MLQVPKLSTFAEVGCQAGFSACHSTGVNTEAVVSRSTGQPGKCIVDCNQELPSAECSAHLPVEDEGQGKLAVEEILHARAAANEPPAGIRHCHGVAPLTANGCHRNDPGTAEGPAMNTTLTPVRSWGYVIPPHVWVGLLAAVSRRNASLDALIGRLLAALLQQQKPSQMLLRASLIADESESAGM